MLESRAETTLLSEPRARFHRHEHRAIDFERRAASSMRCRRIPPRRSDRGNHLQFPNFTTSLATGIDLTFDWCKVVLRRRASNARRRCTPILSATFDIYRFKEGRGREDCYADCNRDAVDFGTSYSRSKTLRFVFDFLFPTISKMGISYLVERKNRENGSRER